MFGHAFTSSRRVVLLFPFIAGVPLLAIAAPDARLSESYGKLPLQFEANRGQTDQTVRFLSRGAGYSLYLTSGEAVLVLSKPSPNEKKRDAKALAKSVALRMSIVDAARKSAVTGVDELPGKVNYFIGDDRSKWRTGVPTYSRVHYKNVYPGIDLLYYGKQRQLEYDFVVAPGADPNKIVLGFKGAEKLEIDAQGDLVLHAAGGDIRQHKPLVYQEIDGVQCEIDGGYVRKGTGRVGFEVAAYDRSRPLVIDPVLSYATYLGGSSNDFGGGIAVDATGAAYVAGMTSSIDFPVTAGAFDTEQRDLAHMFVAKMNAAGSALVYSTFLSDANGSGIAVDAGGNAYVTGQTRAFSFPTTAGAFRTTLKGSSDVFVTKLDATGSALVYSTLLGGSGILGQAGDEVGRNIAVDATGAAYVVGITHSSDFPTTPGAAQPIFGGGRNQVGVPLSDVFVTKLNPTGSDLAYSTFLGGNGDDDASGIAVDADGNAYVTGSTKSINFPTTPGAFGRSLNGSSDAFVTKLDTTGSVLVYSTYLGGSGTDFGRGIAVNAAGNAYVTGQTSSDFPTTAGAYQPVFTGGASDAFVTKLDPTGSALVYSTYLGSFDAEGDAIAVDAAGNAHVTGTTFMICGRFSCEQRFPTTPGAPQPDYGGSGSDAFVAKLNPAGSALVYSSYLGGNGADFGSGIALDTLGNAYITGRTNSSNLPVTGTAFQPTLHGTGGASNAFIAKFADVTRSEESAATEIGFWRTFGADTGSFSGGSIVASNFPASTALFGFKGTALSWIGVKCNVCGIAAVSIDGGAPTTVDTAGPNAPGSLASEPVFSVSGLAAGTTHVIAIIVTGRSSSGGRYVAVDAFDVTAGGATSLLPLPVSVPGLPRIPGS